MKHQALFTALFLAAVGATAADPIPANQLEEIILDPDGPVYISCLTTPGYTYHLEYSTSLNPTSWTTVPGSSTTAIGGQVWFTDTNPDHTPERYYRAVSP